ncbi:hypothetical protein D8I24_0892 [Cupriavidus necator H850]|nr:hypothetical protein D8I24_0892 [Cupriavidus necator H850]
MTLGQPSYWRKATSLSANRGDGWRAALAPLSQVRNIFVTARL